MFGVLPSENEGFLSTVFMLRLGRREELRKRGNPTVVALYCHAECVMMGG